MNVRKSLVLINRYFTTIAIVAIAFLLLWFTSYWQGYTDLSRDQRYTLSEASIALLNKLETPIQITAFVTPNSVMEDHVKLLLASYQRAKPTVDVSYINPDISPDITRATNITQHGQMLIRIDHRSKRVEKPSESEITNAIFQLSKNTHEFVAFVEGHGERQITGKRNDDWGIFGKELQNKGFQLQRLHLASTASIPENTKLLVIASPSDAFTPGELDLLNNFLAKGGQLLVAVEPSIKSTDKPSLADWLKSLGIEQLPGVLVDPNVSALFKIPDATMNLIVQYETHPALTGLEAVSIFPQATAFSFTNQNNWTLSTLLRTLPQNWMSTLGRASTAFDAAQGDLAGPHALAVAGERALPVGTQRLVIIGDGDFLSNSFIGNGANMQLGINVFNWLIGDEDMLDIPSRISPTLEFSWSRTQAGIYGIIVLLVIPIALIFTGSVIWYKRQRK